MLNPSSQKPRTITTANCSAAALLFVLVFASDAVHAGEPNMATIYYHTNEDTLNSQQLVAVREAMAKINRLPAGAGQGRKILRTDWSGHTVQTASECFVNDQGTCTECLRRISNEALRKSQNSLGVNWRVQDCLIRYEVYDFDSLDKKIEAERVKNAQEEYDRQVADYERRKAINDRNQDQLTNAASIFFGVAG